MLSAVIKTFPPWLLQASLEVTHSKAFLRHMFKTIKQVANYQTQLQFFGAVFAWTWLGVSLPQTSAAHPRSRCWSHPGSPGALAVFSLCLSFHANRAVTFQWAQFCFVRLLSITPDPSRQSLNSSEPQPFPTIRWQVTRLNGHTVRRRQQLPHPPQPPSEVWGFCNLLFHKRQLAHLKF